MENGFRYSDICYYDDYIYAIRSKEGAYYIDKINLSELLKTPPRQEGKHTVYNIRLPEKQNIRDSKILDLKLFSNWPNPNFEGITIYNGEIYLVSDNAHGTEYQGPIRFIKVKKF